MNELDRLYIAILQAGLVALRNAAQQGDLEHCMFESEHLHELASLIGESNRNCHLFYATQTRQEYLKWATSCGREAVSELLEFFYSAPWKRIDGLLGLKSLEEGDAKKGT